jgi:cytochrome c biogenesis protein CcmG/thiol:disulfide interchange protein DsbE
MAIKNKYHIPIYGLAYKDDPKKTETFLKELGNPYSAIGNDNTGEVAMDFGVYGTPETFIIDKKGTIVYRHVGVLDQEIFEKEFLPIIQQLG